jgi:hypothetical protein
VLLAKVRLLGASGMEGSDASLTDICDGES